MNERIKELATQATRQYSPTYYTQEWIQGFAQLIVRECVELADNDRSYPYTTYGNKIREHFGIK